MTGREREQEREKDRQRQRRPYAGGVSESTTLHKNVQAKLLKLIAINISGPPRAELNFFAQLCSACERDR